VRGLDQTGLSQKAGPVVSDVRLSRTRPRASNRATAGSVDLLIALDQLVAAGDVSLAGLGAGRTAMIVNAAPTPTASMVVHPDRPYPIDEVGRRLDAHARRRVRVDATAVVTARFGDDSVANVFLLGVAAQSGELPVPSDLVEQAITLNGVAVERNIAAYTLGRQWVADGPGVETALGLREPIVDARPPVERLAADLVDYQSAAYAARYRRVVEDVDRLGHPELTDAVARNLYKLMAYKDEYEVARLLLLPESRAAAAAVGGRRAKVVWHLHPPALRALGVDHKIRFGRWSTPIFVGLRAMRRVRGTPFDPFGMAKVRRVERAMVREYVTALGAVRDRLAGTTDPLQVAEAVAIAELPDRVRGYERLKLERAAVMRAELRRRVDRFTAG
jgi:indolepyruvate ferredoxin oxidoreductase